MTQPANTHPVRLLLTNREAAQSLGVSIRTLDQLVADGQLPYIRVGRLRQFSVDDLRGYVDRMRNGGDR